MEIRVLGPSDTTLYEATMTLFGESFDELDTYTQRRPSTGYVKDLLSDRSVILLAAQTDARVVGALAAYELRKFEQERSEIYVYDLGVDEDFRRRGIASALIERLQEIASERAAWVIFIQADYDNDPAIALYSKLGKREEVLHFDIPVPDR